VVVPTDVRLWVAYPSGSLPAGPAKRPIPPARQCTPTRLGSLRPARPPVPQSVPWLGPLRAARGTRKIPRTSKRSRMAKPLVEPEKQGKSLVVSQKIRC